MARDREPADARGLERTLQRRGPSSAAELIAILGVSQPTFSRLVGRLRERLLVVGRARSTRYALKRAIRDVGEKVPIYEISEFGKARELAWLHAVEPQGFYVEAQDGRRGKKRIQEQGGVDSRFYDDLPYFLHDMCPAGFLGRLIPERHPELGLPRDVRHWSPDHALVYLSRYGWNTAGSLIVGDAAFRLYLKHTEEPPDVVEPRARKRRYPALAEDVLKRGAPGSSAAGEQPKFLVAKGRGGAQALVKFSPPVVDGPSQRVSDLLVAEHLAHDVLGRHGHAAAKSEIVTAANRTFLEVERFDRTPHGGRRGLISCFALDAEYVGSLTSWSDTTDGLVARGLVAREVSRDVRFRELFGQLIANTDMHPANLSFFTRGTRVVGLAPAYDMLPMLYANQHANVVEPRFELPLPNPGQADIWSEACTAAEAYWSGVASNPRISRGFQRIARRNLKALAPWPNVARRLPEREGPGQ